VAETISDVIYTAVTTCRFGLGKAGTGVANCYC
jgi:hypothetical protein